MSVVVDEVIRPNVVPPGRAQPDAGTIIKPETTPLGLFPGNLQSFASPQSFDPFVVDLPTRSPEQGRNSAIAIPTILPGKLNHVGNQLRFIGAAFWPAPLGRAVLPQNLADTALRHLQLVANMINTQTAARRTQKFPRAASCRIPLGQDSCRLDRI